MSICLKESWNSLKLELKHMSSIRI